MTTTTRNDDETCADVALGLNGTELGDTMNSPSTVEQLMDEIAENYEENGGVFTMRVQRYIDEDGKGRTEVKEVVSIDPGATLDLSPSSN